MYLPEPTDQYASPANSGSALLASIFQPVCDVCWTGRNGRNYDHTVYCLIGCPAPNSASYLLVHRDEVGKRLILAVSRTRSEHASVNLAEIRLAGATLGANEVHVYTACDAEIDEAVAALSVAPALAGPSDQSAQAA